MSVPILRHGRLLIAALQPSATDRELENLVDDLGEQVSQVGARGVVVDVSALDLLDSFATRVLETVGQVTRLRGAETVIVGIQPDVALAMVQLGVTLESVQTGLDLEDGIRALRVDTDLGGVDDN